MYIAQAKRRENIAEYILYLWQLEDLLRALQFSPEAIYSKLVQPYNLEPDKQQSLLIWYMELANLLREEGKQDSGHLEHTLHLIRDLNDLHLQLLKLPAGEKYRELFTRLSPELAGLREKLGKDGISDIELCFRALYATMLYNIKNSSSTQKQVDPAADVKELISPVISELSAVFHAVEKGELELFGENNE